MIANCLRHDLVNIYGKHEELVTRGIYGTPLKEMFKNVFEMFGNKCFGTLFFRGTNRSGNHMKNQKINIRNNDHLFIKKLFLTSN